MKTHFMWIVLILPFAIASPTSDGESVGLLGSPPMVEPKRTSFEDLLKVFKIHDLERLSPCQQNDSDCPIDKEALLKLVEYIYQVNGYVYQDTDEKIVTRTTPSTASSASTEIDDVKQKLKNHLTGGNLVYLVLRIHGPKLEEHEVQRLKELYTIVNNFYANDLKIITQNLDSTEDELKEILLEKTLLDQKIDIIIKKIESTKMDHYERYISIMHEINQEQYLNAMTQLYQLDYTKMLIQLGNIMEDKLLKFTKMLPSLTDRLLAYKAALANNELGYSLFALKRDITLLKSETPVLKTIQTFSNNSADFKEFEDELERQLSGLIDHIAALIITGEPKDYYSDLITYTENHEELFNAHLEKKLFECIMKTNYSSEQILNGLLNFSNALTKLSLSARVFLKSMDLPFVEQRERFFNIYEVEMKAVCMVKKFANNENHPSLPQEMQKQLEHVRQDMPSIMRNIFWQDLFCIRSHFRQSSFDRLHRESDGSVIVSNTSDLWRFELNKDCLLKIRHAETDEYLIMARNVSQNESRKIFTSREHDNQHWNLKFIDHRLYIMKNDNKSVFLKSDTPTSCFDANSTNDESVCNDYGEVWYLGMNNDCR